jgi:hypothetical protein
MRAGACINACFEQIEAVRAQPMQHALKVTEE